MPLLARPPQNERIETLESILSLISSPEVSESDLLMSLRWCREAGGIEAQTALEVAKTTARAGNAKPLVDLLWGPVITEAELLEGKQGLFLEEWGWDLLNSALHPANARVWAKGNTGCGKNFYTSLIIICYYLIWDDAKIFITRDNYEQAVIKTFAEVKKWLDRAQVRVPGSPRNDRFSDSEQHFMQVTNPKTNEAFRGGHSEEGHVLFVIDEASSIPQSRYDMADTQAHMIVSIFNPTNGTGPTRKAYPKGDRADINHTKAGPFGGERLLTIGANNCCNVRNKRLKRPIVPKGGMLIDGEEYAEGQHLDRETFLKVKGVVPGQTCYDEFMALTQNADPQFVRAMAYGKFPLENVERQVIAESWIAACVEQYKRFQKLRRRATASQHPGEWKWDTEVRHSQAALHLLELAYPIRTVGIDVAGSEKGDESVLVFGSKHGAREIFKQRIPSVPGVADWAEECCGTLGIEPDSLVYGVDSDGLGKGLADTLKARGYTVVYCYGSSTENVDTRRFTNARVSRVCTFGERINPKGPCHDQPVFLLPDDELLHEELLVYEKIPTSGGVKVSVTPKRGKAITFKDGDDTILVEPVTKQIGRSPDTSDALFYMYDADNTNKAINLENWL